MNSIFYNGELQNTYIDAIIKEIYRDRVYDQFLLGKEDIVTVDIGANLGLVSQYLSKFSKQVYAVEPSKEHVKCIWELVKHNKIDNIKILEEAISDKDGNMTFYHNANTTMFSLNPAVNMGESETVKTVTMDSLFKVQDIKYADFVKLDVEGSEFDVLGCESFANVADKIGSMMIEYHTWSGRNVNQLHDILRKYNFRTFVIPSEATLIGATK